MTHSVGKRLDIIADNVIWKLSNVLTPPTFTNKLAIYSDGNKQYITALLNNFRKDCLVYGQLVKFKKNKRFVYKLKRKVFGNPPFSNIDTVNIESYNAILRERISRLVRRTRCFSKKRSMVEKHLDIFQAYNNGIKQSSNGKTPAVTEGLTSKKWEWTDIFMYR